jgi:hypothetical protein
LFEIATSASGTTDPEASSTVPDIVEVAACPNIRLALAHKIASIASIGSTHLLCLIENNCGLFTLVLLIVQMLARGREPPSRNHAGGPKSLRSGG